MSRDVQLKHGLLAFMLAGFAVAAHAQIVATPGPAPALPSGYCTGPPFTLTAGDVHFHVGLDDVLLAPAMNVTMRLYNSEGRVVAARTVTLAAGQTRTLDFRGTGLLRAQATFESLLDPGDRRETTASVEVLDVDNIKAVIPVKCVPNENVTR
jgi:hypothetical protein